MAKVTYVAIVEASPDGIGVTFPELPGCVSWSPDGSEVIQRAEEALSLHLEGLAEEGMDIPAPRNFGEVVSEAFKDAGREVVYALVTVEAPDASERVNIYLAKSLLERIDAYCRDEAINRSAFFVQAARTQLGMMRPLNAVNMITQATRVAGDAQQCVAFTLAPGGNWVLTTMDGPVEPPATLNVSRAVTTKHR